MNKLNILVKYGVLAVLALGFCVFCCARPSKERKEENFIRLGGERVFFPKEARELCDSEAILDFECLVSSYPKIVTGMVADDQKRLWLVVYEKDKVLYDDGKKRTYEEALENGSVKDAMAQAYPLEPKNPVPDVGFAPGRVRSEAFLQAVYGDSKEVVEARLVELKFQGQSKRVLFNKVGGASKALERVIQDIELLLKNNPSLSQYVFPLGGTFSWRPIAGEKRLSPHSYGIAIDLNTEKGLYWQWTKDRNAYLKMLDEYPKELVKIFEDNGFIWGGKWREFDLMHFEYRPELICKSKRLAVK